jgi:glycerophosphoryl diester phosphodiesterase
MRLRKTALKIMPALLAVMASMPLSGAPGRAPLPTLTPNLKIMRSAHRGVSMYAPENTLPAIRKAIAMGYDYVEMDIHYTLDGVPVLMHDDWVNRTTNGFGPVSLCSLAALQKLDAGAHAGPEFKGTRVPTLEQALQLMQGKIKLYLDQKQPARPELIRLLKKYGFYPGNMVVCHGLASITSFLHYEPDAPVMPMLHNAGQVKELVARYPGTVAFDTTCEELTPEMVKAAHQHGVMIFTDAIFNPSPECMARPVLYGADLVQIDNPAMLDQIIRDHSPPQ